MTDASPPAKKPRALIFQSYGWRDAAEIAQKLAARLRTAGYEVWIDRERIREQLRPEDMFPEAIRRGIDEADVVLVLMSPHSVRLPGSADNIDNAASVCLNEIIHAHGERKPIVPVVIVPCEPPFLINIVRRIDLSSRGQSDEGLDQGVDEILQAIELARQRGSSIFIPQLERLHPIDFRNELLRDAGRFTGRRWLFGRFHDWLDGPDRCLLIEGDAGSGKSAFVSELIRRDPDGQMLAFHFCRRDQPTTIQPAEFVRSLAAMIGGRIEAYGAALNDDALRTRLVGDTCIADPLTALFSCIVNPLAALPSLGLRYIVVDALDEAPPAIPARGALSIPQLLSRALPDLPPWLKLVLTSRRDERVTALFGDASRITLASDDPLQRADVAAFLGRSFAAQPTLAEATRASAGAVLAARSAGNFLYAAQVADAVTRGTIALGEIDTLPDGLGALYARVFRQYFPDAMAYADPERILAAILAAKQPLTAREIAAATGLDLNAVVRPVFERLTGYLVAEPDEAGETVYTLFHKSLADWLAAPAAGTFQLDLDAACNRLLGWCRTWQSDPHPYALRHLIAHLFDRGAVDEAVAAVRAGLLARRSGRMVRADLDDGMALASALIARGDAAAVVELATSGSPWQRDGATAALIAAPDAAEPLVKSVVDELARTRIADPNDPPPDALAARRIAIRTCEARGYDDRLLAMAKDKVPAVRVILSAMLYSHWQRRRDAGWRLIDGLAAEMFGFMSLPNGEVLEVLGHTSLAILNNHLGEAETMGRLMAVWRAIAQRAMRGPLIRIAGRKWALDLMLRPLFALMKRQPAYQPFNVREMEVTFARPAEFRRHWRTALACLEHPEQRIEPLVEILATPELPFDVFLMLVAERALICHAQYDLAGTVAVIERLFDEGAPWFQQSALYALFHILQHAPSVDEETFRRYGAMTERFFADSGATMHSSVGDYSFPPHLAWPEIVSEKHRPDGEPWLLPRLLEQALASGDPDRLARLFKAIDLIGFAYGRVTVALGLVERAQAIGGTAVEPHLIETLANLRFQDQALVDEFLERPDFARFKPLVRAASPTIRGEDIPTWVDGFVVQSMLTSPAFHREYCAAFRRSLDARSATECLRQILVWVIGLLAAGPGSALPAG